MKRRLLGWIGLVLAVAVCFAGCSNGDKATPTDGVPTDETAQNGTPTGNVSETDAAVPLSDATMQAEGLYILEVFPYSGAYVEDGSNEPCENVCAVRLENRSETHYRYLRFSLKTSDENTYHFTATTLFAGARMTVLCEEKTAFTGGDILSTEFLAVTPFDEPPTVHLDTMQITYTDGFINVKNLTDAALSNVYVYFKDTDEAGYLGGITYRASFGDIPAGEITQVGAANIHQETGKIVFATYDS